jgi:LmbE family N-acetylglucosaminyl deacetylase
LPLDALESVRQPVLPLHFAPRANQPLNILCIGAHCDDIEIGCGGTLLALQEQYHHLRVHWLVLTSGVQRHGELLRSAEALIRQTARGEIRVHDLPDGYLPAHFTEVKTLFEQCRAAIEPDWVLSHHGGDRHQDHALLSEVTWQTFRGHGIWEYEIPKYDGDLSTPNVYVPLPAAVAQRKAESIINTFRSQHGKPWFRAENLLALMRLRGLECRAESGFAEGFHCRKLVFTPFAPPSDLPPSQSEVSR